MASYNKVNNFVKDLAEGVHQLQAAGHQLKVALLSAAPTATQALFANWTEIAAGNGYTAGGDDVQNDTSLAGGTLTVTAVDVTITCPATATGTWRRSATPVSTTTRRRRRRTRRSPGGTAARTSRFRPAIP